MSSDSNFSMAGRACSSRHCNCVREMYGPPPWSRAWPIDEHGRMTFLKIPQSIQLHTSHEYTDTDHIPATITSLPSELKWSIMAMLPAVDRVCLAITCKSMAASAISSPHLRAGPWTPWLIYSENYYPSRGQLIQRLAHGWIDKSRLRYCQTCFKILPREPQYWWDRLCKKTKIPWDVKVKMERDKWTKLNKKKRFEHIITTWCEAEGEDSSVFSCKTCVRTRILGLDTARARDLEKGGIQQKEIQAIPEVPVECPACVEHSLTNRWKEPRKPKVRPFMWKWTKKVLSFCGNTVLVSIYLLYLLLKAPVELGMWLWKKYKGNKSKFRRLFA